MPPGAGLHSLPFIQASQLDQEESWPRPYRHSSKQDGAQSFRNMPTEGELASGWHFL